MAGVSTSTGAIIPSPKSTGADSPNQSTESKISKPINDELNAKGTKDTKGEGMTREYVEGVAEVIPHCDYTNSIILKLNGVGKIFSGNYYVQKATHTLGESYNVQLEVSMVEGDLMDSTRTREEPVKLDPPKAPEAPGQQVITIKRGDTLWALSRKYGTTVQELAKINGIKNPDLIYAGASLKVPVK